MKNILFLILFTVSGMQFGYSQVNPNAIGLRGGSGNLGFGGEISYQKGLGSTNRLELDFGLRGSSNHSHLIVTGIYHWVKNLTDGLNWYIGPGAQLGLYSYNNSSLDGGITIAAGGQLGIEYDFSSLDIPLLLSLDTRPMFNLIGYGNRFYGGGSFALRYIF